MLQFWIYVKHYQFHTCLCGPGIKYFTSFPGHESYNISVFAFFFFFFPPSCSKWGMSGKYSSLFSFCSVRDLFLRRKSHSIRRSLSCLTVIYYFSLKHFRSRLKWFDSDCSTSKLQNKNSTHQVYVSTQYIGLSCFPLCIATDVAPKYVKKHQLFRMCCHNASS